MDWEEIPRIDQNGEILEYQVLYQPSTNFSGQIASVQMEIVPASQLNITIDGLEEFLLYSVSVRGGTLAGFGPYSTELQITTAESGMLLLCICSWP